MGFRPYHWFNAYSQHQADVQSGRRRGQSREWNGPTCQIYVFENRSPVVLDITDYSQRYKISTLHLGDAIGEIVGKPGAWSGQFTNPLTPGQLWQLEDEFTDQLTAVAALPEQRRKAILEEARIQNDPALSLERELRGHDWTYHYSDDHRAWSAGDAQSRRIRELLKVVPADTVRTLWAQYSPSIEDYPCPV